MSNLFTRDEARDLLHLIREAAECVEKDAPAPVLERGLSKAERMKRIREFARVVAAARVVQSACSQAANHLNWLPDVLCNLEEKRG
jgi:hypothetical protein